MNPQRVVVIGDSCAGKTTFARALALRLAAPHVQLDEHNWLPNWQAASTEVFRASVAAATTGSAWVVDGNYTHKLQDLVWAKADTIIWLDPPLWLILVRFFRRSFWRAFTREEVWNGNRESLRNSIFSKESLLVWIVTTHGRRQKQFREAMEGDSRFVHLRSPRDCSAFLRK